MLSKMSEGSHETQKNLFQSEQLRIERSPEGKIIRKISFSTDASAFLGPNNELLFHDGAVTIIATPQLTIYYELGKEPVFIKQDGTSETSKYSLNKLSELGLAEAKKASNDTITLDRREIIITW